jgi:hypothetical protein
MGREKVVTGGGRQWWGNLGEPVHPLTAQVSPEGGAVAKGQQASLEIVNNLFGVGLLFGEPFPTPHVGAPAVAPPVGLATTLGG